MVEVIRDDSKASKSDRRYLLKRERKRMRKEMSDEVKCYYTNADPYLPVYDAKRARKRTRCEQERS